MTYHDIVIKSEQFETANRGADAEHTKPGYQSKVTRCANSTSARCSYPSPHPMPDKGQPPQNHLATPGSRSTASAGTEDPDWDEIKKTLSEKERIRLVLETVCSCCGLAEHNF